MRCWGRGCLRLVFLSVLLGSTSALSKPSGNGEYFFDPGRRMLFALYGDSITSYSTLHRHQGWALNLEDVYDRRIDILNRGHSGYNTRWARMLFPYYFNHLPVDNRKLVLFLFLGANDAVIEGNGAHVPVGEYKANLKFLINLMQKPEGNDFVPNTRTIIVITPPPVDEGTFWKIQGSQRKPLLRVLSNTERYANASVEVATQENGFNNVPVYCIDIFHHLLSMPGPLKQYLHDGLHFSVSGNRALSDKILHTLSEIPGLRDSDIKYDHPPLFSVNQGHPEKTFHTPEYWGL